MNIQYYPGCTLHEKSKDLDIKGRKIAELFGYTFTDIPDWTCCGSVFPNSLKNIMKFSASYRMLAKAEEASDKLVVLCSACFNVLRRANLLFCTNPEISQKLSDFTEVKYNGNVDVVHYLEFLRDTVTFDRIKKEVETRKTKAVEASVAPYYGCLLLRPYEELKFDDPENPVILSDLIEAAGDKAIEYPMQNSCCGSYLTVYDRPEDFQNAEKLVDAAIAYGADQIITSCPLCYYNLDHINKLNVLYFTDYLATKLGIDS